MEKMLVFGHKSPDTDTICSAIVMADFQEKLGKEVKAVRLGEINKETKFALEYFKVEAPEMISGVEEGQEVVLVDHNEFSQSADGIEKASISYVTVSIEVEETKENEENEVTRVFEVEYTTSGLASGLNMTASSNKVKIVLRGSKSKLDSISIENIVASIDLSSITEAGQYTETPAVNITGDVQGVEISSVESVIINITKEEISEGVFDETTTDEESTLVP